MDWIGRLGAAPQQFYFRGAQPGPHKGVLVAPEAVNAISDILEREGRTRERQRVGASVNRRRIASPDCSQEGSRRRDGVQQGRNRASARKSDGVLHRRVGARQLVKQGIAVRAKAGVRLINQPRTRQLVTARQIDQLGVCGISRKERLRHGSTRKELLRLLVRYIFYRVRRDHAPRPLKADDANGRIIQRRIDGCIVICGILKHIAQSDVGHRIIVRCPVHIEIGGLNDPRRIGRVQKINHAFHGAAIGSFDRNRLRAVQRRHRARKRQLAGTSGGIGRGHRGKVRPVKVGDPRVGLSSECSGASEVNDHLSLGRRRPAHQAAQEEEIFEFHSI